MNPNTKDQIDGQLHQLKGKVKEVAGQILGNPKLETEGQIENLGGTVQEKVGQVERVLEK